MDARADDAAGCAALRHVYSWAPAEGNGTDRTTRFSPAPIRFPRMESVTGYQRPHSAVRRRLRSVRQRQDRAESQRRTIPVCGDRRRHLFVAEPGLQFRQDVTNRAWTDSNANYAGGLRPAELRGAEHERCRRRHLRRADRRQPELRQPRSRIPRESIRTILSGWGIRPYNWQLRRIGAARAAPRRVGRSRLQPASLGQLLRHLQRAGRPGRLRHLGRAGPKSSRACRTPAARNRSSRSRRRHRRAARAASRRRRENVAGETRTAYWHGVDVNATARLAGRVTLQMGTSTGRGVRDTCALWRARPQTAGQQLGSTPAT